MCSPEGGTNASLKHVGKRAANAPLKARKHREKSTEDILAELERRRSEIMLTGKERPL